MRDTLTACKGKFLVSYNDCEFIRELYKDFQIESVSHLNNLCALSDGPEDEEESDDKNSLNLPAELLEDAWFPPTVIWKSSVVTAHCHFGIRYFNRLPEELIGLFQEHFLPVMYYLISI